MQNGCICCTLRGDLLEAVAELAEQDAFDYILIESTGISEPMQVAETFTTEFLEESIEDFEDKEVKRKMKKLLKLGGIEKVAKLDTCVTVIDACNFMACFETADLVSDRFGEEGVEEEDERTITDLMVDQIEFADIILLNKTDLVSEESLNCIKAVITKLNPVAKLIPTQYSRVDLKEILNTGLFDFEKAATSAGWLQSLNEMTKQSNGKMAPKPETEEYGISSFIYARRRPFHPARLHELINDKFFIIQDTFIDDEDQDEGDGDCETESNDDDASDTEVDPEEERKERLANKKRHKAFGPLLRSKGFMWLATRPLMAGEWSQAGCVLTIQAGSKWFGAMDEEEWADEMDPMTRDAIKKDFVGEFADRRQELVFIGAHLDRNSLEACLDKCLLTDAEMSRFEIIMRDSGLENKEDELVEIFEDPFEPWPVDGAHDHEGNGWEEEPIH